MKRFFTALLLASLLSHSTQEEISYDIIDMDRVHYIVEFRRAAKEILIELNMRMEEIEELIKLREESGHTTEIDSINHIILYYVMKEIEYESSAHTPMLTQPIEVLEEAYDSYLKTKNK